MRFELEIIRSIQLEFFKTDFKPLGLCVKPYIIYVKYKRSYFIDSNTAYLKWFRSIREIKYYILIPELNPAKPVVMACSLLLIHSISSSYCEWMRPAGCCSGFGEGSLLFLLCQDAEHECFHFFKGGLRLIVVGAVGAV